MKITKLEITSCGIVCRGEFLTQLWRHGRIECDGCQKGDNSILWCTIRETVLAKGFSFNRRIQSSVCLQKNSAAWKGVYTLRTSERQVGDESEKTLWQIVDSLESILAWSCNQWRAWGSSCTWSHLRAFKTSLLQSTGLCVVYCDGKWAARQINSSLYIMWWSHIVLATSFALDWLDVYTWSVQKAVASILLHPRWIKWCPVWWQINAPRARINSFSLLLWQWVWNVRNKVKWKYRRLLQIEESSI